MKKVMILLSVLLLNYSVRAQSTEQKLDQLVSAYADMQEFRGSVLVAMHGQVLLEKGYGPQSIAQHIQNDTTTIYEIASVTKTFTSAVVLKLAELHQLSLNDKLSKYYPKYPHADSITITQLLSHTAGIYDYTHNQDFMFHHAGDAMTEQGMIALFENQPLDFQPGKGWSYSNSGYMLLGYIIQKVTGMSYQQAVRKYIFRPLGMNSSGFNYKQIDSSKRATGYYSDSGTDYIHIAPLVDSSVTFAAGSIYSTVGDLYKWNEGLLHNQIISPASQMMAYTPVSHNYGFGWIIDSLYGKRMLSHSGGIFGFRSNFARIPEDDVCIVLLSNTETPSLSEINNNIIALLYGKPYRIPVKKKVVQLSEAVLNQYAGSYQIKTPPLAIEMKVENGVLVAYPYHGPRGELAATDETHFFLKEQQDFEVEFIKDSKGKVIQMRLNGNGSARIAEKTN